MKKDIHPKYGPASVTCGCGNTWETQSTKAEIRVEVCSKCHPFYTGTQKFVDTAGRVEKFQRKYRWTEEGAAKHAETAGRKAAPKKAEAPRKKPADAAKAKRKPKVTRPKAAPKAEAVKAEAQPAPEKLEAAPNAPKAEPVEAPKIEEAPAAEAEPKASEPEAEGDAGKGEDESA